MLELAPFIPDTDATTFFLIQTVSSSNNDVVSLRESLLLKSKQLSDQNDPIESAVAANIARLLEFHGREDKPVYWRYFDRLAVTDHELFNDSDCLAMCKRTLFSGNRYTTISRYETIYHS